MRFRPDAADRADWAARLAAGRYMPLKRFMATQPVAPEGYWQACSLVETLLADYPQAMPEVVHAFAAGRSAHDIVTGALQSDWLDLEARWKRHVLSQPSSPTTAPGSRGQPRSGSPRPSATSLPSP